MRIAAGQLDPRTVEQDDETIGGFREYRRRLVAGRSTNLDGLIVAMERLERNRETFAAPSPRLLGRERSMRHLAQRTVTSTESGADPIGNLTTQSSVGVVDTDQTFYLHAVMRKSVTCVSSTPRSVKLS